MKYHDNGFITYYKDYIHLQLFSVGNVILNLKIYKDQICKSTFKCLNAKEFNKKYINQNYPSNFLYTLFSSQNIHFKDKNNKILIRVK